MDTETTESGLSKRKKTISKIGLVFIVLIILLTLFSNTIYYFMLPQVDVAESYPGTINFDIPSKCVIEYSVKEGIRSDGDWIVKSVNVKANKTVAKGGLLATIASDGIMVEKKKMELEIEKLQADIARLRRTSGKTAALDAESGEIKLETMKNEYDSFIAKSPPDGRIVANGDCVVKRVNITAGSICSKGQVIIELARRDSPMLARWSMKPEQAVNVKIGQDVEVITKARINAYKFCVVDMKSYNGSTGMYDFYCYIKPFYAGNIKDGENALAVVTKSSYVFQAVVPNSSIVKDGGSTYVFELNEKKTVSGYIWVANRTRVNIIAGNNLYSGLAERVPSGVVSYSSKPLEDGMQVKRR